MKKEIESIASNKASEFKKRDYSFFKQYINDAYCFNENINSINYEFEIHVTEKNKNKEELLVMCEASQIKGLLGSVGFVKYFAISKNNEVRDLNDDEVF